MESAALPTIVTSLAVECVVDTDTLDCVSVALLGEDLDFGEEVVPLAPDLLGVEGCELSFTAGPLDDSGLVKLEAGEFDGVGLVLLCSTNVPVSVSSASEYGE